MKLGTSQRGPLLPALVATMVLAGIGVSVAGQPNHPDAPTVSPSHMVSPHAGHSGEAGHESNDVSLTDDEASSTAACGDALEVGSAALEDRRGLERAIEVVLANCGRNHASQGLVNALQHLQENLDRRADAEHGGGNAGGVYGTPSPAGKGNGGEPPGQETSSGDTGPSSGPASDADPGSRGQGDANGHHGVGTGAS